MTLAQIMRLALRQLDEDPADIDDFRDLFIEYFNEGYSIAVNDYLRPRQEYIWTSDDEGNVFIHGMGIRSIVEVHDEATKCEVLTDLTPDGDKVHVYQRQFWEKPLKFTCRVELPRLVNDDDEPQLPEETHLALADYICYRYKSTGNLAKQSQAQPYYSQFVNTMQRIRADATGAVTRKRNLYLATSRRWPF